MGFLKASLSSCLPKEKAGRLFFLAVFLQQNNSLEDACVERYLFQIIFVLSGWGESRGRPLVWIS